VSDALLNMCKAQGYVPAKCSLPGPIVWGLINRGEDPCVGCRADRTLCDGRPYRETVAARAVVVEAAREEFKAHDDCYCDCQSGSCPCGPCKLRKESVRDALADYDKSRGQRD
jgi:hypothetical protein